MTDANDYPVLTLPPVVFVTEPEQFVMTRTSSGIIADEDNLNNSGSDDIYWSEIGGDVDPLPRSQRIGLFQCSLRCGH